MCLTDKIFLQTHVTFCEYLVFHEFKRNLYITLAKYLEQEVNTSCGLYWNEISNKLAKQGAMKNMSEISSNNLILSSHEINSLLKKTIYKQTEKSKFAIPSCSFFLYFLSCCLNACLDVSFHSQW